MATQTSAEAFTAIIQGEEDCSRARAWANYLGNVARIAVASGLIIVVAAAVMVLFSLWLVADNKNGQALASGVGAVVTGTASAFVFSKASQYGRDYNRAADRAKEICDEV